MSGTSINLSVNGTEQSVTPRAGLSLLLYLRNELGLSGAKLGCGTGSCGACTILMDGVPVQSCQTPLGAAENTSVQTIEALAETLRGSRLTQALIDEGAAQCGYCLPGIVAALLAEDADVDALGRNICRCGTQHRILAALKRVADV